MLALNNDFQPVCLRTDSAGRLRVSLGDLSEVSPVTPLTATGSAYALGACLYRGFRVLSVTGDVSITVYDALSATGVPIHSEAGVAVGGYLWSAGARRPNTNGVWVVLSGTGSAAIEVEVEPGV